MTPFERQQRREPSRVPTPEPDVSTPVFPPALTTEQLTKLRYLGMAEALRRSMNGSANGLLSLNGTAASASIVEPRQIESDATAAAV